MEKNFQKIQKLLSTSDLSFQEQDNFLGILLLVTDEELKPLVELFTGDTASIHKIYDNYKAKQAAFAGKDQAAWAEILKVEESLLQEMSKEQITQ